MPSNSTSNNIDFVPPTRKAKESSPQPWPLPYFEPLHNANFDDHGSENSICAPRLQKNVIVPNSQTKSRHIQASFSYLV